MRDFAYARAGTAETAVETLASPQTAVIAGGTELLNWFRLGIAAADRVSTSATSTSCAASPRTGTSCASARSPR